MTDSALVTMDDLEAAVRINAAFEEASFVTEMVSSLDNVGAALKRFNPDVVVLTGSVHERPAAELISMARDRSISVLGLLEPTESDPTLKARQLGLTAWVVKPSDPSEVIATAGRLIERRRMQERTGIVGESAAIQEVLVRIGQMAPVSSTVLISGESGTGKELVAQGIHQLSPRREKSFIAVNCAALPESLLESELFGHEKGAFTGAAERRLGRFELADGGTIFLDEVGEMPRATQVKLLRVLENQAFFRVGGTKPIRVDVRVIAATNRALKEQVALGHFRDDLFYRLNVLTIYLPPLRERKSDIPILIRRFTKEISERHNLPFPGITKGAIQLLVNAHWPGNVRQLRNLIESMVVLAPGRKVSSEDIPLDVRQGGTRLLPVRVSGAAGQMQGHELEFIFRSLVELKLQFEELRRRMDGGAGPIEVIDVGREAESPEFEEIPPESWTEGSEPETEPVRESERPVVYRSGMTMSDVERAAIEAALDETNGNRRRAAERLGIGERTLYRKIREFGLS